MWTRAELKSNAKMVLKRTYWLTFAVLLVAGIIGGMGENVTTIIDVGTQFEIQIPENLIVGASLFSLLVSVFISGPLMVGKARFLMQAREYDTEFTALFSGFNGGEYWRNVKVMIMKSIKIFLWTCLLIIPGIIKAYEYYFVTYILAENPYISQARAFEISKEMTRGYKWDIFVLELSFFGWYLLGALCLGVGTLFVNPYYEVTLAELYAAQRAHVLSSGIVSEEELCGFGGYTTGNYA